MAYTWKRAARAILVTASTTGVAFLATGFSEILPISAFGIYASIIVPVNYILVITMFPSVLSIYEKYIKENCCTCCQGRCKLSDDSEVWDATEQERYIA